MNAATVTEAFTILQFLGFLVGVIVSPSLTAKIGRKWMLTLALICIIAAYLVLGGLPSWNVLLLLTIVVGFGSGIIEPSVGAFTIEFTENQKRLRCPNWMYFSPWGTSHPCGSCSVHLAGSVALNVFTVAACALMLMIPWVTMPRPAAQYLEQAGKTRHSAEQTKPIIPKTSGIALLFIIFFFVYMGLELGLMNFLPSILVERLELKESIASLSVSILWIAMIVGRLFSGRIAEAVSYMPFLIWSTIGTLLFTVCMVFVSGQWVTYALIFGTGLFMSGLFCIALVYANVLIPGMTERTTSILIASGGIGGATLQYLTGWSMSAWPIVGTIMILAGFCLLLLLTLILSHLWNTRNEALSSTFPQQTKEI